MANTKKLIQAAAGAAGGAGLNVEEVFSTYLYTGNSTATTTQQITNGIDLSGEGGLVWTKSRTSGTYTSFGHGFMDTERGIDKILKSNATDAETTISDWAVSFNSDGFTLDGSGYVNENTVDYASWTFRKAPKFFDVVTYSGSVSSQSIAHNLGSTPGLIITKKLDSSGNWAVYHRSLGATKYILLNSTNAANTGSTFWNDTEPTSTHFTVGTNDATNNSVRDYVAYLFAHNNGDGDFGPTADQDIIKCGSYSQSSASDVDVDLGFEPQFVIVKRSDNVSQWYVLDEMRGFLAGSNSTSSRTLYANLSNAEADFTIQKTATGFTWPSGQYGSGTQQYIYIAIRRGPMAVPESATDVFDVDLQSNLNNFTTTPWVTDLVIQKPVNAQTWATMDRLRSGRNILSTDSSAAENTGGTGSFETHFDYMNGVDLNYYSSSATNNVVYNWKRAPNHFDVVAYTGSSTSGYATISHNLGVVPEMVWFKNRSSSTTPRGNWYVYHKDLVNSGGYVYLNSTSAEATDYSGWASSTFAPSATSFTVIANTLHYTNENYIAYFFASVDGVSKVGSFTGNGSSTGDSQDIDCGFSSGARFVLVKAIGAAGAWFLFDTERGIVAGNDSHLSLNSDAAEDTSRDLIDPLNSGFTINYHSDWGNQLNGNGQTYIFYAIA